MRLVLALILVFTPALRGADLALSGATVYPSPETRPIPDAVIVVRGARITAVGPRVSVPIPKNIQVIDCSGKYIVAGFWNSHVHMLTPGLLRVSGASTAELNAELDAMFNRWGFTLCSTLRRCCQTLSRFAAESRAESCADPAFLPSVNQSGRSPPSISLSISAQTKFTSR
jgi:hypothetical protein